MSTSEEWSDPAELQNWVDRACGGARPSGVVEELIRERRGEADRE